MEETLKIDHSDIPIRLFKSDFLEFFTHVHPIHHHRDLGTLCYLHVLPGHCHERPAHRPWPCL